MNHGNSKSSVVNELTDLKSVEDVSPGLAVQRAHAVFKSLGLIRPMAELLFKKLMVESPEALLDLLNRILNPERPFVELVFLDTEVAPEATGERATALNLLLKADDGKVVNIEVQDGASTTPELRAVHSLSRLVYRSLLAGNRYDPLPECILIFMIEGAYFPERDFAHQAFEFLKTPTKSDPELGQCLFPTAPKIHFIEWGKLISPHSSEDSRFKDWVHFLLPQSVEDWERIAGDDPMFSELKMKVELYSADDKLAMQQRAIDEAR